MSQEQLHKQTNKHKSYDRLFRFALSIQIIAEQFLRTNLDSSIQSELDLSTLQEIKNESINLKFQTQ